MTNAAEVEQGKVAGWMHPFGAIWRADNCPAGIDFAKDGWQPLVLTSDYAALVAERDALRHDNAMLTRGGIIEVAVRNPSVTDYMQHWENRAEVAEYKFGQAVNEIQPLIIQRALTAEAALTTATAQVAALREALEAEFADVPWVEHHGRSDPPASCPDFVQVRFRDNDLMFGIRWDWDQNWQWFGSDELHDGDIVAYRYLPSRTTLKEITP